MANAAEDGETSPVAVDETNGTSTGLGEKADKPFTFRNKPRARPTLVCKECRRMKLKCDRQHPCSMCVKRSTQSACEYETPVASATRKKSRAKITGPGASEPASSPSAHSHDSSSPGHQHQSPESTSFLGLFTTNLRLTTSVSDLHSVCHEFLNRLPPADTTDFLIDEWRAHSDMLSPIIHWPTFLPEVRRVVGMRFTGIPSSEGSALLWLISLIMGGFAVTLLNIEGHHEVSESRQLSLPDPEIMLGMSKAAWNAADTLNAPHTLVTVQALAYHSAYLQFCHDRSRPVTQGWGLVGLQIGISENIQLHKDPGDDPNLSTVEKEMRRRMWWSIYMSERIQGLNVNKPPMIRDSDITTRLPLNLSDEDLLDEAAVQRASSNTFPTFIVPDGPLSTFIYKCGAVQLRGRVRDHLQSRDAFQPAAVMELHSSIQGLLLMIPGELSVPDHLEGEERVKAQKAMHKRARERCIGIMSMHELLLQIHSRVLQPLNKKQGSDAGKVALNQVMSHSGMVPSSSTMADPLAHAFHTCLTSSHAVITACATLAGYQPETSTAPSATALSAFTITSTTPIRWRYPVPHRPEANTHVSFGHKCFQGAVVASRCILHHPSGVFVKVAQADLELAADLIERTGYDKSGKMKMLLDLLKERVRATIQKAELEQQAAGQAVMQAEMAAHIQAQTGSALAMSQSMLQSLPMSEMHSNGSSPIVPLPAMPTPTLMDNYRSPPTLDSSAQRVPIQPDSGMCSSIPTSLYASGTDFFSAHPRSSTEFFSKHPEMFTRPNASMAVDSPTSVSMSSAPPPRPAPAPMGAPQTAVWPEMPAEQLIHVNNPGMPSGLQQADLNLNFFDPPFPDVSQPYAFDTDQLMDWYSSTTQP